MDQPHITLNNAVTMPALGLGILNREQPQLTQGAVEAALAEGPRLIDTAAAYGNGWARPSPTAESTAPNCS